MAIIKNIELNSGIEINYHRVASVNNITNVATIIEIQSYTSKEQRNEEKKALENKNKMNVFINTEYIEKKYEPSFNISLAYEHIKTLEKFKGYIDDIES